MGETGRREGIESAGKGESVEANATERRELEKRIGELEAELARLRQQHNRQELRALALSLFVFGLAAWLYLVGTFWVAPSTITGQLTHFAGWPRTDTFGEFGFVVSFLAFLAWNYLRETDGAAQRGH